VNDLTPSRAQKVFEAAFQIRPDEFWRVQIFFAFFALIGMFYTIGTTVGDTLFLSRFGASAAEHLLPWLFIGITIATVAVSWIFNLVEPRVPRITLIVGTQLGLAASLLIFREVLRADVRWLYFGLAVWLEVCALISIMLFFSLAGDYFTSRDARRLYGYITGGLALGNVLAGYASVPLVRAFGPDNLLYPCAALLLGGPACVLLVSRAARPVARRHSADDDDAGAPIRVVSSDRYLRLIFLMVAAGIVCSVLLNYQFKITAVRQMRETDLAIFFGKLYALSGVAQLAVQFALVQWLLGRFGIVSSLLILPALMLLGSIACFVYPVVLTYAVTNGVRISLTETLDLPARELLFLPLAHRIRLRAQALLGGILVPLGRGLGGILLLVFAPVFAGVRDFALISAGSAGVWLVATYRLRRPYTQTLSRSLRGRQLRPLDLEQLLKSGGGGAVIDELLRAEWPGADAHLLELARTNPDEVPAVRLAALAGSSEESVAVGAVKLLGALGARAQIGAIQAALGDPRASVRAVAALALCEMAHDEAVPHVARLVEASENEVRAAALAGCAKYGGLDGTLVAYPRIQMLLHSKTASDRAVAVSAIGLIGGLGFGHEVERLLNDPDAAVREQAVLAGGLLRDPVLIAPLVAALSRPELRAAAIEALESIPETAVSLVAEHANDPDRPTGERLGLVQAIGAMGGPDAVPSLWRWLDPIEHLVFRVGVGQALRRLRERGALAGLDASAVANRRERLADEIALVERARQECGAGDPFCASLFFDHTRLQIGLLASLFSLEYEPRRVLTIEGNLFSEDEALRANALELVEATLPRGEASRLVPLLSSLVRGDPPTGRELSGPTTEQLLNAESWLRVIVIYHQDRVERLPASKGAAMTAREAKLYDLMPTVAMLKRSDFFGDVPANYLASLAAVAHPRTFYKGETLLRNGEVADALYVLCEGRVGIILGGREVWQAAPPNCLGDISLIDGEVEPITAVALEDVQALRVSALDFDTLIMTQPPFAKALLRKLARRVRDMAQAAYVETSA
jgi:ATP/ADP translocase/HEAT repeat protein